MIDIGRIEALRTLVQEDGSLHIGAMVTVARLALSQQVQTGYTALAQAAALIGNPNVRRTATVGRSWRTGPFQGLQRSCCILLAQQRSDAQLFP